MEHLLFAAYLVLFAWLTTKIKFFTETGLTNPQLVIIFFIKVMAGIFYGWIGVYYGSLAQMVDTWGFHYNSIIETNLLKSDPKEFVTSFFNNPYESGYGKFFSSEDSWWNDLDLNFFIKFLALLNVASFGHYYINLIFFSFITLFGTIAFYRVMQDVFPEKKLTVLLATVLLPSFLYWTGGIHKDGIVFLAIAFIVYHIYFGLKNRKFTVAGILMIIFPLLLILVLRNYLLILLLPALLAWILSKKLPYRPVAVFAGLYLLFTILFFSVGYIHPKLDFPKAVVNKQQAFLLLSGGSAVTVKELQPNFKSFLLNAPEAASLAFIRPYPSDVKHLLALAAAAEINLLLLLFVIFLFWKNNGVSLSPFLLFCIFFAFTTLLTIGYTVNFLGAIVRYRSIVLPFLVVPMLAKIDWKRIGFILLPNITFKNNK
ncbi:MAG: hypothetical protein ABR502_12105 [Chitinophagaceae bacterium]